jgi:hypothetical protein
MLKLLENLSSLVLFFYFLFILFDTILLLINLIVVIVRILSWRFIFKVDVISAAKMVLDVFDVDGLVMS